MKTYIRTVGPDTDLSPSLTHEVLCLWFHDNFQKIIDEVPGINSNLELSETAISDN